MLWYLPWSENFKKRACRYLLQRYLGNFLEEKLTLDQLSVDLYNGTGTVSEVSLDCQALNELGDAQSWPLEIVDGYMREITVTIPWSTLLKDDSVVKVNGLILTVQPKVRSEPASSMLESMWSSMSSSMQLAAECLQQDDGPPEANPVEGIEMFAHAIDSILSRVKVKFVNTKIRIEHVPKNSDRGIALEIHIDNIDYYDEAGSEPPPEVTDPDKPKTYIVSTYTNKRLMFEGITLYTDEFPSKLRTMARSLIMEKSAASSQEKSESQPEPSEINFLSATSDIFYETKSILSNAEPEPVKSEFEESIYNSETVFRREVTPEERANQPQPILFAKLTGKQELALKIKHTEEAVGPKVDLQMTLGSLIVFLTPRQMHTLMELVNGLNQPHLEDTSNIPLRPSGVNMQCKPMGQADFQRIEAQLMGNFSRENKPNLAMYGWTGQSLEDSETEDRFQPMSSAAAPLADSMMSSVSSMTTSATSSVHVPAAQPRTTRNRKASKRHSEHQWRSFQPMSSAAAPLADSMMSSVSSMTTSATSSVHVPAAQPRTTRNRKGCGACSYDNGPIASKRHSEHQWRRFPPMSSAAAPLADSMISSVSSMTTSATSSVHVPAAQPRTTRNRKVPQIDGDPTAEVSHINIKISSCTCILLHKDILVPVPLGTDCVTPSSAKKMEEASTEFFGRLGPFSLTGHSKKDLEHANEIFDGATGRSHLRLITSALTLDGSEKTTSSGSQTACEASVTHLLLRECLYKEATDLYTRERPDSFDLIKFLWPEEEDDNESASTVLLHPNVRINFKQTLKYIRISGEKKLVYPTTDISIKCMPFTVDIELTILERMSAQVFGGSPPAPAPPSARAQLNVNMQCASVDAVLRFPIADLRPGISRATRRVRPDYLQFGFQDVVVSCSQTPSARPLPTTVTVRATTLDAYYYENEMAQGIHIARANMDETYDPNILKGPTTTLPTISLTFQPSKTPKGPFDPLSDDEQTFEPASNPMTTSMHIMNNLRNSSQPTPFSNKKTAHQSITKHEDTPQGQAEELIVPGNEEEMAEFTSNSVERASIHLDLNLPILSLQLESKQLYEIIYNRINSDLLLWEPVVGEQYEISPHMAFAGAEPSIYPAFSMCKNAGYDSDSASTSSDEENLYYSAYESKMKQNKLPTAKPTPEKKETHNFCLTLKIDKGLMTIYTPYRDANKLVVPGQMGTLVVDARALTLCSVSGLGGVPHTARMCLRASQATLYHDAVQSIPAEKPPLRLYGTSLPLNLKETIYPSAKGVMLKEHVKKDMLSLALKVEPQPDLPNFKKICMTLGIEHATLRHRGNVGIAWLTQLLDVLDVEDYNIPGYQPSTVLTELHVHVWDCAIDYRPLYLPIRTVLNLGSFSVSSNVIAQTNTSSLRFLAQECCLSLSHTGTVKEKDDDKPPDVLRDYVCVIDLGLFELSLRIADKRNNTGPRVDLSASNNVVNFHTCWDSLAALCRLITYLAGSGDCQQPPAARAPPADPHTLVGLEDQEEIRELSPSEIQQVNDLMAEAMKESPNTTLEEDEIISSTEKEGVEIFFFPDESNMPKRRLASESLETEMPSMEYEEYSQGVTETAEEARPTNANVANELGDPSASLKPTPQKPKRNKKRSTGEGSNTDDEYCIIESSGCSEDELAEPTVRWFGSQPVPFIEKHFTVPAARSDVLKAPRSFPPPELRYTLCEMSVVWHLFGGNDFKLPGDTAPTASSKKNVTINEGDSRQGSPKTNKRTTEYEPYEAGRAITQAYRQSGVRWSAGSERVTQRAPSEPLAAWRTRGGPGRDQATNVAVSLSKIKFQHETYPAGGTHAARQTLAISKIEVLDRLEKSHINKLLSQYVLKDEPERKNAHMLVVKAVHLRPMPGQGAEECCLKVSLLPLKFNVDQDTLSFLMAFCTKLGAADHSEDDPTSLAGMSSSSPGSRQTTPTHRAPVMSVGKTLRDPPPTPTSLGDADALSLSDAPMEEPLMEKYQAERLVSENLIQLEEDFQRLGVEQPPPAPRAAPAAPAPDAPLYLRRVVFSPEVPIRLDYVGKRVDLSAGPVAGLLMGLGQLNCSELRLKRLYHRHGLLGVERLVKWAIHEWLSDIKRHQLPGLLSGIGPMHSLLQFVTGIRDLLWLPVEQWRRDGRLVHGLRRGAASFTARTAVAAIDITQRILHLIQATAETAFDMLTPGPTLQLQDAYDRRTRRRQRRRDPSRHPNDIREGVASAYQVMKEGFAETAATITIAARSESGVGVLRHLPGAAVSPLALAAAGAADVLGGVRASLAPTAQRDHKDKYRHSHDKSSE